MIGPLLTTKLHVPPTPSTLIARRALLAQLDDDLAAGRVTLISAPAGYGKTTLVAQWIGRLHQMVEAQGRTPFPHIAWLSLDEEDNDETRFLTYLTVALQFAAPVAASACLAALQPGNRYSHELLLTTLIEEIQNHGVPTALVLDDYHYIRNSAIHDALAFLCTHQPESLQCLILTRAVPPLPVALLRSRGRLREIRGKDLALSPEESLAFVHDLYGLDLPAETGALLAERTEGWVAGLQMAGRALQRDPDALKVAASLSGSQRDLLDYFSQEVIDRQSEAVRTFLLQTSLLEWMSAELCDAVLGPTKKITHRPDDDESLGSQAILDYLEEANLFLVPLDDVRIRYRYHHLLRELLQRKLEEEEPARLPILHRRASHWFAEHDLIEPAIEHALAGADYSLAVHLIGANAQRIIMRGDFAVVERWLDALPESLLATEPELLVYRAAVRILEEQPLHLAEIDLDAALPGAGDPVTRGASMALRGLIATFQGRSSIGIQLLTEALALTPEANTFWRSLIVSGLGLSLLQQGELSRAYDAFLQTLDLAERTNNLLNSVLALCHLGAVAGNQCRCDEARRRYEDAIVRASENGRPLPLAGMGYSGLGLQLLELGEVDAAIAKLQQGLALIRQSGAAGVVQDELWLAAAYMLKQDWQAADAALRRARQLSIEMDVMSMDSRQLEWEQVRLWLARGDLGPASGWLERQMMQPLYTFLPETRRDGHEGEFLSPMKTLVMARVCLEENRPATALSLLAASTEAAHAPIPPRMLIDIRLTEALALQALDRPIEAQQRLSGALALAAPCSLLRPFLEQPKSALAALLAAHAPEGAHRAFVATLQSRLTSTDPQPGQDEEMAKNAEPTARGANPLTPREREILSLIAQGESNRQISAHLVISLSTVKTHINNIYRKLSTDNRGGALAEGYRLGLL